MKRNQNKIEVRNLSKTNGITLIALVVTIVVLIILATISINAVFGENGIIKRAEASKKLNELEEEKQRLELIKTEVLADNLGKMTVDQYIEALKNNNITVDEDIISNPDGSKTVITDTGYSVLIEQDGERNVKITIEGKAGNLPPRIVDVTLTRSKDKTSIIVNIEAVRTEGATLKYWYKTSSGSYQAEAISADNTSSFTITGVDANETYTVKVELSNEYGAKEKEVTEEDERPLVTTITSIDHENIVARDRLGNQIAMPGGFKIAEESGDNVEDGIVIEDSIGNQFVWVPVSNIDGDGVVNNQNANGLITKKDGSKVQITLGRYTFARTLNNTTNIYEDGTPALYQRGIEYNAAYPIVGYVNWSHSEFSAFRESNYKGDLTGQNATAKDLQGFIESVRDNYGYYIARYEASFGSGDQPDSSKINTAEYITNQKPLSKPSTAHTRASNTETLTEGMLWNWINQGDASKVSRNMYVGNGYVESDLVNSYMWDTAIVYIQAMGNENYANQTDGRGTLKNTGETEDEKCHIFDMAGNTLEWTTEYGNGDNGSHRFPSTVRGGDCSSSLYYVTGRGGNGSQSCYGSVSFRTALYVK